MKIVLSKASDVPVTRQLADQIIFLITTDELRPGDRLPSVRTLARQLNIHHNTVSGAYRELVERKWLARRRGSRLEVTKQSRTAANSGDRLDELIQGAVVRALEMGYSLQAIKERVIARLRVQPPDHILLVEEDSELRQILREELRAESGWQVDTCSPADLTSAPELALGAQVVVPQYALEDVSTATANHRTVVPVLFSSGEELLQQVNRLSRPSVVAVASVSRRFLETARSILSPLLATNHQLVEHHIASPTAASVGAVDVVVCDSVAFGLLKSKQKICYKLVSTASLRHLRNALPSFDEGRLRTLKKKRQSLKI